MDPFMQFGEWYEQELRVSAAIIPSACCLSTIGIDGYPNARFVSLKELRDERFIITGPLQSRKGQEITAVPRAALSFWWPSTQRQVRMQGDVDRLGEQEAGKYFRERSRESCIVSLASRQGEIIADPATLNDAYAAIEHRFEGMPLPMPDDWGALALHPIRIEFMEFKESRFHERTLFVKSGGNWEKRLLQP